MTSKLFRCKSPSSKASSNTNDYDYLNLEERSDDKTVLLEMENPSSYRSSRNSQSDYYSNEDTDDNLIKIVKKKSASPDLTLKNAEHAFSASSSSSSSSPSSSSYISHTETRYVSSRQVKLVVVSFGIRIACTGLLWDHFVHKYHDLLMVYSNNPTQRVNIELSS